MCLFSVNIAAAAETPSGLNWHSVLQKTGHFEQFMDYMSRMPIDTIIENANRRDEFSDMMDNVKAGADAESERMKVIREKATAQHRICCCMPMHMLRLCVCLCSISPRP